LRELLTPLAYAEGEGLPRALWPAAATALAERNYGIEDLDWLLDTAADYLIEQATSEGGPLYRLYHQALADYLQSTNLEEELARQRRLVTALLKEVRSRSEGTDRDWSSAQPYLTRHMATHAAVVERLDELLVDPGFLLAADQVRLLHALPAATTPAGRQAGGVYRLAAHQLRDRPVEEAAAYLQFAARQQRALDLADRIEHLGFRQPWSVRWAVWEPVTAHRILSRHGGSVLVVAVGELDGRLVVVSGGSVDVRLRVWDLATGTLIAEPFTGHDGGVNAVAVGELDGRPVVVSGGSDGRVRVWDLATGTLVGKPFTGLIGSVLAVAVGELDGRPVVVSGGSDTTVRVWEPRTGRALVVETGASIAAIVCMSSARILAATESGLALLQLIESDEQSRERRLLTAHGHGDETT
jgi:hypothetical protein